LIAVGEPGKLEIIDAVLKALDSQKPTTGGGGGSGGGGGEKPEARSKSQEKVKSDQQIAREPANGAIWT